VCNVGTGVPTSNADLAAAFEPRAGLNITVAEGPASYSVADTARMSQLLGLEPEPLSARLAR
jgi:hypothetical protein